MPVRDGVVPGGDGAGEVVAVGKRVLRFKPGDKVYAFVWQTGYFAGWEPGPDCQDAALGSAVDGTFRQHGVFNEEGLLNMPPNLTYEEGAALNITFATVWNALMGGSRPLHVGDCVLTQGTGGVSIAALQIAIAAGATVIATTSSSRKESLLKKLGVHHVINYQQEPEWGTRAKVISPGGAGCNKVIEVGGGQTTFKESLAAVATGGEIAVVGFLAPAKEADEKGPTFFDVLMRACSVRGVQGGSREHLEEVNRVVQAANIKPAIDQHIFHLSELKEAYQYLSDGAHFGKVIVKVP